MQDPTKPSPNAFMLLFRNTGPENYQRLTPDQRQALVADWNAWYDTLLKAGKATEGQPLEIETRVVSGPGGARVTDGPFPEAKEAIGGYVKLKVDTVEEATEIAKLHPALAYGLVIEVRELTSDCHLGVSAHH